MYIMTCCYAEWPFLMEKYEKKTNHLLPTFNSCLHTVDIYNTSEFNYKLLTLESKSEQMKNT